MPKPIEPAGFSAEEREAVHAAMAKLEREREVERKELEDRIEAEGQRRIETAKILVKVSGELEAIHASVLAMAKALSEHPILKTELEYIERRRVPDRDDVE